MSDMETPEEAAREQSHLHRLGPVGGVVMLALIAVAMVISWVTESSRRIERRHEDFVAARVPWHGRSWGKKEAVLYRDVDHPLTWHVCTESGCGFYFEEEKKSEH